MDIKHTHRKLYAPASAHAQSRARHRQTQAFQHAPWNRLVNQFRNGHKDRHLSHFDASSGQHPAGQCLNKPCSRSIGVGHLPHPPKRSGTPARRPARTPARGFTLNKPRSRSIGVGHLPHPPNRSGTPTRRTARGFTLIEIMITVLLVSIIGTITSNGISNWLRRQLHESDVQEITRVLYQARQQSLLRGEFSQLVIDTSKIDFTTRFGVDGTALMGSGVLDLEDSIEILQAGSNMESMLTLFYTNKGHILTGTSQFRVCTSDLEGEAPILFTISPSGRVTSERSDGLACP